MTTIKKLSRELSVEFTHNREAQISVGVLVVNNDAIVSASFLNTNSPDQFCYRTARSILSNRIAAFLSKPYTDYVTYTTDVPVKPGVTTRDVITRLRRVFKPLHPEASPLSPKEQGVVIDTNQDTDHVFESIVRAISTLCVD